MSDGHFGWWWWYGPEEGEGPYSGPFATKAEALADAENELGKSERVDEVDWDRADDLHHEYFHVLEADKQTIRYDVISADRIVEEIEGGNEDCWGEDGPEIALEPDDERDLEKTVGDAIAGWLAAHPDKAPRAYVFGTTRNHQIYRVGGRTQ